eukprot:5684369-Ditylum_brightwellii.AAC.1
MLKWLEGKYGQLQSTRDKVHDYLRMMLDFQKKCEVKVIVANYVQEIIEDFPKVIQGITATPAAEHLFEVEKEGTPLEESISRQFDTSTTKLLFLCKRVRPHLQTAVAFLTTRVKEPSKDA